ncbi:MAG: peptidylprolyl isomerase, partial [Bacteroidota bacterium]
MSIIQTIQEKYAKVMAVIIALALIIFVVMLAFENGGGLFSGSNNIGEVNGTNITSENFSRKVQAYERNAQQQQQGGGEMATAQAVEQAWNDGVDSLVMAAEYKKLGLTVTDREINAVIFSDNAPQEFKQIFTDPQSGVFDANLARQQFNNVKKQGSADQKNYLNAIVDFVERQMLMSKYTALLTNTIHFPKWMLEKRNVDNSLAAKVSFVGVPYVTIADSTIKISDAEINDYIKAHEKDFQQKQESRSINYVSFSAAPNGADSNAMRNAMLELKKQFDTVTNYQSFVARNSTMPLYEGYVAASAIQQQSKDSILAAGLGNIYGPYLDAGQQGAQMVMSKIFGVTQTPDTVTVRHILVATHQQGQDGQLTQVRDDSSAKKLIDSLQGAIAAGTSFDTIVVKFSDDPGSKEKGGKYED